MKSILLIKVHINLLGSLHPVCFEFEAILIVCYTFLLFAYLCKGICKYSVFSFQTFTVFFCLKLRLKNLSLLSLCFSIKSFNVEQWHKQRLLLFSLEVFPLKRLLWNLWRVFSFLLKKSFSFPKAMFAFSFCFSYCYCCQTNILRITWIIGTESTITHKIFETNSNFHVK